MDYIINGTNLVGVVTLHRVSAVAAIKKARELISEGYLDVRVTAPDGRIYGAEDFANLYVVEART